ncbi:MAG: phosphoribosylamine--glycine ligase [Bdellovibrionales bacterium]|nr:phosphoribosylamine--glycine ligase [Bdellovibrionales bacterium]
MNVLVVGKGGREHAIVRALNISPSVQSIHAVPGNPAMENTQCHDLSVADGAGIAKLAKDNDCQLVIVGPEDPLAAGLADTLRAEGLFVFGPDQAGARLEASKVAAKEFMKKYSVPTSNYQRVASVDEVEKAMPNFTPPYVLKADGLAAGKGVFICQNQEELLQAARELFEQKTLGSAGDEAILEQFQPGYEISYFVLTNGEDFCSLPLAQDHKRLRDNDQGPNTGGMGTVAPMRIPAVMEDQILQEVVKPTVQGLKREGFVYRGVVFIGLMITDQGPKVIEYNIRFGDPETQVLLPLMSGDWGEAFLKIAKGAIPKLTWSSEAAACVVIAAENYPGSPVKGVAIQGEPLASGDNQYFLHAGTALSHDTWVTAGGRVLNAIGRGSHLKEAIERAYDQAKKVSWPGMQLRSDIGKKALKITS